MARPAADRAWPRNDDSDRATLLIAGADVVVNDPRADLRRAWEGVGIYR